MVDESNDTPPKKPTGKATAATPEVPAGVDPNILFLAQTMAQTIAAMQAAQMTPAMIQSIMSPIVQEVGATVSKARWPENTEHPHISAFSYPEGDIARPKPTLTRQTWFNGIREDEERLKPSEIDGYNAIVEPKAVRGGSWRAEIRMPTALGAKPDLYIWVPAATVDQRMQLPSLILILHELGGGENTDDVIGLMQQIEALKALVIAKGASANELESALLASK